MTRVAVSLVMIAMLGGPTAASAHSGFQASEPADGAVLDSAVSKVTVTFGAPVRPAGFGFEARTPDGLVVSPESMTSESGGARWVLVFSPALSGGRVAVRWRVRAQDAHPISGAFTFTSSAPASSDPAAADSGASQGTSLIDFISPESASAAGADELAFVARALITFAILIGVGGLAFATLVLRGPRGDVRYVIRWIRRGALLAVVGSVFRLVAVLAREAGTWGGALRPGIFADVVGTSLGMSILLSLLGGFLLAAGAAGRTHTPPTGPDLLKRIAGSDYLERHFAEMNRVDAGVPPLDYPDDRTWDVRRVARSPALTLGVAALVASPLFAGHTVTQGNRFATGLLDLVHVVGAAIWAGGLIILAALLARRHRRRAPERSLQLVLRFSVLAALSVIAVWLSGIVQAVVILDAPGELFSTVWGRVLLVKTALAVGAGAVGAYNHRRLLPALADGDPGSEEWIRTSVRAEAALVVLVGIVAAVLVSAAA